MRWHLSVAEPWDFEGPDGPNAVVVEIQKTGHGRYGDWAVCSCKKFEILKTEVSSLLLSLRHSAKDSLLEEIEKGIKVAANAYWRKNGEEWDDRSIAEAQSANEDIGGWLVVTVVRGD